jgi:hypothetical protein
MVTTENEEWELCLLMINACTTTIFLELGTGSHRGPRAGKRWYGDAFWRLEIGDDIDGR